MTHDKLYLIFIDVSGDVHHIVEFNDLPTVSVISHHIEDIRSNPEHGLMDIADDLVMTLIGDGQVAKDCIANLKER